MAFQGSLAELHLPDIIQLISVSGKSGVFHLTDGPHHGQIYLHDGKIVHAEIDDASGEEAVYALAIWSQGDFKFEPGVPTEKRTISKSNTNLLMEAARRLDEWRVLSKKIPSTDHIPEFVVQEHREGQINLNTGEWLILSKIDGQRSIKEMAAASGLSVFDVAKILYGLVATSLIRLRDPGPALARAAAAAAAAARAKSAPAASPAGPGVPVVPPVAGPPAGAKAAGSPAAPAAAPAVSSPGAPVAVTNANHELLGKLDRMRDVCKGALGPVGESVINKHYLKAKADLEAGGGFEAIQEAMTQIARASSILKGPETRDTLLEQLKAVR
jgi:hypothetical protein